MNEDKKLLYQLKLVCRWALGLVWIWEGLVPKILMPTAMQTRVVENSGIYWPDPAGWLMILGAWMILVGIVMCIGWLERLTVLGATVAMTILIFLVVGNNFYDSVGDMHGGLAKDFCLYACAWVVWKLAPSVPGKPV
ncbi:DoxX-like family protein [Verrucomicrobiales bacterium]|nr:DoxX-like family protein [Verrucomicrobiales bacterium]